MPSLVGSEMCIRDRPYGPDMQYSDEKPASEITLYVYTGKDGAFTLYEDEGVNYNYEKGQYATIPFAYNDAEAVSYTHLRAHETRHDLVCRLLLEKKKKNKKKTKTKKKKRKK